MKSFEPKEHVQWPLIAKSYYRLYLVVTKIWDDIRANLFLKFSLKQGFDNVISQNKCAMIHIVIV